ncbi:hypothetical protein NVP1265O_30 [Vibrio phage 1.265.O._10N.286.52.F6]|nr:hypothetical protein NVP1265O_30 [Vibrio phage 1.265.O._10N.286.52.F6]
MSTLLLLRRFEKPDTFRLTTSNKDYYEMITQELVKELLHYDPETGEFTHKHRGRHHFSNDGRFRHWNDRFSGLKAGKKRSNGYWIITIFNKAYRAHRIAWLYVYGSFPSGQIDHINGVRNDNRIKNLRDVNQAENGKNQKRRSTNTSGVTGVWFSKQKGKYVAEILVNGVKHHIGTFESVTAAAKARKEAERKFGFHKNHGRIVNSSED